MDSTNTLFQKGDKVRIVDTVSDKDGMEGEVHMPLANGAIVKLSEDWFTPVQNHHLEKI